MRENKFRAWDKSEKRMLPVNRIDFSDRTFRTGLFSSEFYDYSDDCILEQFTGLHDKNGVEIYEGDLISIGDKNIPYTVEWHDTGFMGKAVRASDRIGLACWNSVTEVIGNIHEKEI